MDEQIPFAGEMLGATLFLVGLIISWMVWRRRGAAHGLRGIAWSLLLLAAGLVGLIEALWAFVSQLLGSILSLVLWAGIAVAGLGVLLYVVSGVMKARGVGTTSRAKRGKTGEAEDSGAKPSQVTGPQRGKAGTGGDDDFSDIEELLRRRGIG